MNRVFALTPTRAAAALLALTLAGCSSLDGMLSSDTLDYRAEARKTAPLNVPPDLTQLARDARYQPQTGSVSAVTRQQPTAVAAAAPAAPTTALNTLGDLRVERNGTQRWLVTSQSPEQVWPQLRSFWQDLGFTLPVDHPEVGVMETNWAENRAKLPHDVIRRTLGKLLDSLYSTSERDIFRTRVERAPTGTEIYISHRGMVEVYLQHRENTVWQPRPNDPQLEAELLTRLMIKLGAKPDAARPATATATAAGTAAAPQPVVVAKARALAAQPGAALEVDDPFDRAWRRVGLALDRGGFSVEDRDRSAGLYFVRYVDPKLAGQDEPNFLAKLFGAQSPSASVQRYRLLVKAAGAKTQVSVLNNQGTPDNGEAARQIVDRLVDELK